MTLDQSLFPHWQEKRCAAGAMILGLLLISPAGAHAQATPAFDMGWIVQTALQKSGKEPSPLRFNDGDLTFVNFWTVLAEAQVNERLSVFAEIQTSRLTFNLYALTAVYRLTPNEALQVEAGKFLAPFGNFLPRRYASENPLVENPLAYSYRTALSASLLPGTNAQLLAARGQGFALHYDDHPFLRKQTDLQAPSDHIPTPEVGIRVISRDVYLTGVQISGAHAKFGYALAITNGALSNPIDVNNSNSVQVLARLRSTPVVGLDLGASFASAPYLNKTDVSNALNAAGLSVESFRQSVLGVDLAYSRGYASLFAELLYNRWESPFLPENLDLLGGYVEGKYSLSPRVFLAGRWSFLKFSEIADAGDLDGDGRATESWDYDVNTIEAGLGYRLNRHAIFKTVYELNRTFAAPGGDPSDDMIALQAVVFF